MVAVPCHRDKRLHDMNGETIKNFGRLAEGELARDWSKQDGPVIKYLGLDSDSMGAQLSPVIKYLGLYSDSIPRCALSLDPILLSRVLHLRCFAFNLIEKWVISNVGFKYDRS